MYPNSFRLKRVRPAWSVLVLAAVCVSFMVVCSALFAGAFRTFVPVTVTAERAGLGMEPGAKVRLRGVDVGRVAEMRGTSSQTKLRLEISPEQIHNIPANVTAQIRATTVFGAKYVNLVYPERPSDKPLSAGAVVHATNVATEINTVFEDLVAVLRQIDPPKLEAVLTAVAEGVRGQGQRIGDATTAANQVLLALNPRMDTVRQNWQAAQRFSAAYDNAADDIVAILDAFSTTSLSVTEHRDDLDALLLETTGLGQAGIDLLDPTRMKLVDAINTVRPTTELLYKYNPSYTCLLLGAKWWLDNGAYDIMGGNGRTALLDAGFNWGDDPYRYPENLPIVAAKGGPGGKPGCGSLPNVSENFPVRQLITNTGWGTGVDLRPNPGIGHPFYANYLPATRGVPEPPSLRGEGPPAVGPVPYPGAPPYGAPLFGPDGAPLYPPPPPWAPPAVTPAPPAAPPAGAP